MTAASQTKVFGMRLRVDPKILLGSLIALAALLFWYNSRSGDETGSASTAASSATSRAIGGAVSTTPTRARANSQRRDTANAGHGALRVRSIDATRGDVDPTLRLDLLARVRSAQDTAVGRNVFEMVTAPPPAPPPPIKGPILQPEPLPVAVSIHPALMPVQIDIPLKYFGYMNAVNKHQANQGFFMDGDKVLVASEGEIVKGRFLLVQLTPKTARVEDTQLKQEQVLAVTAEPVP
ncbi:MAG: hypothetical protein JO185_16750 [Acidobacteriaceae bacterium]|nr:hypothetical protein [Acidobacteriaceae bacterium]MBV9677989.1 hypothetical protein [Acidobacteriaceae bacterium]